MIIVYGLMGVGGIQLAFFNAVEHLSVGIALLLEYLAPVLLVGWSWMRTGARPRGAVLGGTVTALAGLVLVLDLSGDGHFSWVGVAWGLVAATGLAAYFIIAAHEMDGLPPPVTAWAGLTIGALALGAAAVVGLLPVTPSTGLFRWTARRGRGGPRWRASS